MFINEQKVLRASEKKALEKLGSKRCPQHQVLSLDLARRGAHLANALQAQVGLLVGRDGNISHVVLGRKDRLYLPDLGRFRLDSLRLRRLRLLVFVPAEVNPASFPSDFLTDLEKLRLDLVALVAARQDSSPGNVVIAHLRARQQHAFPKRNGFPETATEVAFLEANLVQNLDVDVKILIEEIEEELRSVWQRGSETSDDRAILVGAYTGKVDSARSAMDELAELARTAGLEVVDTVLQRRRSLDPKTVLGKGKIEELVLHALDCGVDLIVFDRELSPGQLRSITNITELRVIDRSMLILDIFAQRAKTRDGRLQVELAQLKYSLPRLTEEDTGLSRLTGGIGGRGPGETKLEIARRRARDRVRVLEKKIDKLARQRGLRRERRQERGVPVVAIVGYTNAGKSTLLNALTSSEVFVENKLFATLDASSRRMRFPNEQEVVFVDTVGFIRELPKELVNAFRATLEEVHEADLLLHLVDASDPEMKERIEVVKNTLNSIGMGDKPCLLVLNKVDLLNPLELSALAANFSALSVSAFKREGFSELIQEVQHQLAEFFQGQDPGHFVRRSPSIEVGR